MVKYRHVFYCIQIVRDLHENELCERITMEIKYTFSFILLHYKYLR